MRYKLQPVKYCVIIRSGNAMRRLGSRDFREMNVNNLVLHCSKNLT